MNNTPGDHSDRGDRGFEGNWHTNSETVVRASADRWEGHGGPRWSGESEVDSRIGLRISESDEGGFRGEFRLALSGLAEGRERRGWERGEAEEGWSRNALRALFRNLGHGAALEFSYGWSHGGSGAGQLDWRIAGRCSGTTRDEVHHEAEHLYQSLNLAFSTSGSGLAFVPVDGTNEGLGAALPWQCDVSRVGVIVPTGSDTSKTAAAVTPIKRQVVLPRPQRRVPSAFNSIIRAGQASNTAFMVSIRVEALQLSERALALLDSAYKSQRFGELGGLHTQDGVIAPIFDDTVIDGCLQHLRHWSVDPRGFYVRCAIYAEHALPPATVELIGSEVFGNCPVVLSKEADGPAAAPVEDECSVRLTNCYLRGASPLNLLPSMKALAESGAPRVYTEASAELPRTGLLLGHLGGTRESREVRLPEHERSRHCYVMGATGTGKSTLLRNAIVQDIEQDNGVCVVDPHGDLYEQVLNAIPERRARDVVLVDFADFEWPIGLNFLECSSEKHPTEVNFIVDEMMSIFRRLYSAVPEALGPMFETYMRNAMLAVVESDLQTTTLLDVVRFVEDSSFRDDTLNQCHTEQVIDFWRKQAERAGGDIKLANIAPYITSKLNRFTNNALLRPIIGQTESTIDFRRSMDEGRIMLVNLAKGRLGDFDMRLLGMLFIGKTFNAALSRTPNAQRRPFYLYVDEFQNLVTETVMELLSEARKFGLSLTFANQHLSQLTASGNTKTADAILGNVATMLLFRMGPKDAEMLETYTRPYLDTQDLQHLPDYHVACRMLNNNQPVRPFVFSTNPPSPLALSEVDRAQVVTEIRDHSRLHYAKAREPVEGGTGQESPYTKHTTRTAHGTRTTYVRRTE